MTASEIEIRYRELGLANLRELNKEIRIELKYASADNFMHRNMYGELKSAYLEPRLALAVCRVQEDIERIRPGHRLVVFDAARPLSIQKAMFEQVRGTEQERYVANPYAAFRGGFHNYGMAVDMSIEDARDRLLDMGTEFDHFGPEAHVGAETELLRSGRIGLEAYGNRMLLYYAAGKNGLIPYEFEWWHYQLDLHEEDKNRFPLLDF